MTQRRSLDEERERAAAICVNLVDGVIVVDDSGLMQPGDRFVLFSDGLIEAENDNGEPFGYARLFAALAAAAATDRLEAVKLALAEHLGDTSPRDDVSLMLIAC